MDVRERRAKCSNETIAALMNDLFSFSSDTQKFRYQSRERDSKTLGTTRHGNGNVSKHLIVVV